MASEREGDSDRASRPVGLLIAEDFADERLARGAHQERLPQFVQAVATRQEREIVLVRLAETNARIERQPFG